MTGATPMLYTPRIVFQLPKNTINEYNSVVAPNGRFPYGTYL